jgi:hypothetical protein
MLKTKYPVFFISDGFERPLKNVSEARFQAVDSLRGAAFRQQRQTRQSLKIKGKPILLHQNTGCLKQSILYFFIFDGFERPLKNVPEARFQAVDSLRGAAFRQQRQTRQSLKIKGKPIFRA